MAVRPVPSRPSVTSSAVDDDENPEGPFLLNGHIFLFLSQMTKSITQREMEPPETETTWIYTYK